MISNAHLKNIISIDHNNAFLKYIVQRIRRPDYRGMHISQHNRYDLERAKQILQGIHSVVGAQPFLVPPGDDDGMRDPVYADYYKIVDAVNNNAGIGTFNSLKKNFFVDFQKLGFIERFNNKGVPVTGRMVVHSAILTSMAIDLIGVNTSIISQTKIFTDGLDRMFSNAISQLAEFFYYSDYKNDSVTTDEFMLILSDTDNTSFNQKEILLNAYRSLSRWEREQVIDLIKNYCTPSQYARSKTEQRDFHNWRNETQQIFSLLQYTVYFSVVDEKLKLNIGSTGLFTNVQIQRKQSVKEGYFAKHSIGRKEFFELDHIIPFSAGRNKKEFALVDDWKNLVYLQKEKHAEKTRQGSKHVVLLATQKQISLRKINGDENDITAENGIEAHYSGNLASRMEQYNRSLLRKIYGYEKPL